MRSRISNLEQNQQRAVDEIEKSFRLKESHNCRVLAGGDVALGIGTAVGKNRAGATLHDTTEPSLYEWPL